MKVRPSSSSISSPNFLYVVCHDSYAIIPWKFGHFILHVYKQDFQKRRWNMSDSKPTKINYTYGTDFRLSFFLIDRVMKKCQMFVHSTWYIMLYLKWMSWYVRPKMRVIVYLRFKKYWNITIPHLHGLWNTQHPYHINTTTNLTEIETFNKIKATLTWISKGGFL